MVMGPKVGDMRMYLSAGVLCSFIGVSEMMSESCAIYSPDVDAYE